jgi:hypothetical protein
MPEKPTPEMLAEGCKRAISTEVLLDDTRFACESAVWDGFVAKRPSPPAD